MNSSEGRLQLSDRREYREHAYQYLSYHIVKTAGAALIFYHLFLSRYRILPHAADHQVCKKHLSAYADGGRDSDEDGIIEIETLWKINFPAQQT